MIDMIKLEDCKMKIVKLSTENGNKLIYEWVKTNHISFGEFQILIEFNYGME
jgi:hypothetical protein